MIQVHEGDPLRRVPELRDLLLRGTGALTIVVVLSCVVSALAALAPSHASAAVGGSRSAAGYWLVGLDGGIFTYGDAAFYGFPGSLALNKPIVGMAATPDGKGYWLVASDGGIFTYGHAAFFGSPGSLALNKPIVGMAATPDAKGYWLVASDGGIFAYGDAAFYGSPGSLALNKNLAGMAATPDGKGYWLVASDGGIFAYGDAAFYGSPGGTDLNKPIVGMAASPDGKGYWLVASDGGIFAYGDAAFYGSPGGVHLNKPIVGMAAPSDGKGYWLVASDGGIFAYGDAVFYGSPGGVHLNRPIVGMEATSPSTAGSSTAGASTTTATSPTTTTTTSGRGPQTSEHYTANGNFSGSTYEPGADGFNVADVSSNGEVEALPAGVKGLVWIGSCAGATSSFQSIIGSYIGDPKVFGYYLMDEPNPSSCSAADLKAESDWIHANDPGTYTFIIEEDLSSSNHPTYEGGYNPVNSDIDLYGLDPYPCRSENPASAPCAYSWLDLAVTAAEDEGIPPSDIVPVYQAFGGGTWVDDGGGSYQLPTAAQEAEILSTWGSLVPTPVFDYAYSWGVQNGAQSLSGSSSLQSIFLAHNAE